ncbi:TIM barrel protein [Aliifodinibius sp. S!AR15-10]|uniref:TIM barrel protein n=1 Tax=Aliifodinibius sp. S!AR15-10 TaxID=2950437 RepID=UPI00285C2EE2|nr:TIM barrel protein [Aliifodinibius sp. S!AR15-10]MDR8391719.1 TIM barrel protein [Aliifodinibius sp. S!AR15-10]
MQIANAPCSWGILEFGLEGKTDQYNKVLDEMSSTGYRGTELGDWGFFPTDPEELKNELQSRELNLVGAFVPINFVNPADYEKGLQLALKTARLLADVDQENARIVLSDDNGKNPVRTRNAGRIQEEHGLTTAQWKTFTKGVDYVARKILEETGVASVFHHHCAGYVETAMEIEIFLSMTDPELVGLCFDTGHYAFGGGDPLEGLKAHNDRISHVHFKDWDHNIARKSEENGWDYFKSVENGVFCELGKGTIDFKEILEELNRQQYSDWIVVEQDILPGMGTPKESARRNRDYLRSIGV